VKGNSVYKKTTNLKTSSVIPWLYCGMFPTSHIVYFTTYRVIA
jgi:hypothetical protein